ncbi:MAG: ABC transporter permease [Eubacteriales bacterium]
MTQPNTDYQLDYINKEKKKRNIIIFSRFAILICFLGIWECATYYEWIDAFFYSSPSRLAITFLTMAKNLTIFQHTGITILETLISFVLVTIISLFIAMVLWYYKQLAEIVEPYFIMLNSLPKSALAPLLIVWLGTGMKTIIVAGISVAIFGSIMTLYTGFIQMDEEKEKLIYTLGGSRYHILTKIMLPGTIPIIISTMKVNIGLCLVGVIIGEFLAARIGLGYLIIYSSQVFQLDRLILAIVILCGIAYLLYEIICKIERAILSK